MRNADNKAVIRLGDRTDHGGEVKTAFTGLKAHGVAVAGEDCVAWCPKCKGNFRLLPSPGAKKHLGKAIAYDRDLTECGARLLSTLRD